MPRPSNNDVRRIEIVEALLHVMARHGYDGASIAAVATEAKLAPGLVHYHFDNKLEILLSLVEHLGARIQERIEVRVQGKRSPKQRLLAFIDAHVALDGTEDPDAVKCWVSIGGEALRNPKVKAAFGRVVAAEMEALRAIVADCMVEAGRDKRHAAAASAAIYAAIQGSYQLATSTALMPKGFAAPMIRAMAVSLIEGEVG